MCCGWALLSPSKPHDTSHVTPSTLSKDLPSAGWASVLYSSQSFGKRSREERFLLEPLMSRTKQNQPYLRVSCRQLASHEAGHFPYSFSCPGLFLCTCVLITGLGGLLPAAPSPRRLWATVGFCIVSSLRTSGEPVVPGMSLFCPNCCYVSSSFLGFWLQGAV